MPVIFEKYLKVDALVNTRAHVSATAQKKPDTIKKKAPNNFLKINDPRNIQKRVASSNLEKPLAAAVVKIEIGDKIFAEHFVVMTKLTRPILKLHFLRNSSVVFDTTHGVIHFPHLTMQTILARVKQLQNSSLSSLMIP